jgi:hypothetical protein
MGRESILSESKRAGYGFMMGKEAYAGKPFRAAIKMGYFSDPDRARGLLIRKFDQFFIKLEGLLQKQTMTTIFESNDV